MAILAEPFPDLVRRRSQCLVELAFEAEQPETRGYAVDSLGRAGASEALEEIRDRACEMLGRGETEDRAIEILHSMTMESSPLLVDVAPELADRVDSLEGKPRNLATTSLMHAAVHDPSEVTDTIRTTVQTWLSEEPESEAEGSPSLSPELLAEIAARHPELVLPCASRSIGLQPSDGPFDAETSSKEQPEQSNTENAWDILIETGKKAPEIVWNAIDSSELRIKIEDDTTNSARAHILYAHIAPPCTLEENLDSLFAHLLADEPGASTALSTLTDRAPETTVRATIENFEGISAPPRQAIEFLVTLSSEYAEELQPVQETIWNWNSTIQPSDERWSSLVVVLGRIAIETSDEETISEMLHLDHRIGGSWYCKRFLKTPIGSELIEAYPNKTVPPLLEQLSSRDATVRKVVVGTFDGLPDGYGVCLSGDYRLVSPVTLSESRPEALGRVICRRKRLRQYPHDR